MTGWKVLTHDYRPPVQGGDPIWDGKTLPFLLPTVEVDHGGRECSYGWNFCASLAEAIAIGGLWPTGRPNAMLAVESPLALRRGSKLRASGLTLVRLATEDEIRAAIAAFSTVFVGTPGIADEQWLWYRALGRPLHDEQAVVAGLTAALAARGLDWKLRRFDSARAARAARASWDAWDAWAARDALSVYYASAREWITHDRHLLTTGLRDAYLHGLDVALPTGAAELGYAMEVR